jgi:hypothetical protein
LGQKEMHVPEQPLDLKITFQGGIRAAEEHDFLLDHYDVDSVGWGSPFLLVLEATSVDKLTLASLAAAKVNLSRNIFMSSLAFLSKTFA